MNTLIEGLTIFVLGLGATVLILIWHKHVLRRIIENDSEPPLHEGTINCNIGLGQFDDSPRKCIQAAAYLRRHKCPKV